MTALDTPHPPHATPADAWSWWQARRLRYNLVLGAGGALAYAIAVGLNAAFGNPMWRDWAGAIGTTILLGTAYLVVMGAANVCYLVGPAIESWAKPADTDRYRRTAYAMGLWGSLLVPASFVLIQVALLLSR